jgi:signal transduction histidine kinase
MAEPPELRRFSDLVEAAAAVVGETDLDRVLRRLVTEARSATGARYAALGVIGEHGVLSDFLYEGIGDDEARRIGHLPTGRGVLGTVIRLKETIRVDSISDHPDAIGFPPHHPPMSTFLGVPVAVGDAAFGNLYLTDKPQGFTDQDVVVTEALSRIAGAAVRTARLQSRLRRLAVAEDRQRIARDLHDSVIQEMFAVGLGLQGASALVDEERVVDVIADAVDRLDRAIDELRGYIFQLRAGPEQGLRLDDRLGELVFRMGSAYPQEIELEVSTETTGDERLDDEILAIVTEALSNALRHSGANAIRISVGRDDGAWVVRVEDDGVGFDPKAAHPGMGLGNLRSRVARVGGEMDVVTSPGAGTTVSARVPVT